MAIKRLKLTEEHLKLISSIKVDEMDDYNVVICKNGIYGGTHLIEDLALILGHWDEAIENTKEDADGRAFPDELEKHMLEVHTYVIDNLLLIETLVHQFAFKGGLTSGVYKCKDNELIWEKEGDY